MTNSKNRNSNLLQYRAFLDFLFTGAGMFYLATLVYIFFLARRRWGPQPKRDINFSLFREKIIFWQTSLHTRPESIEFYKDLIGNILLFIPFPFFIFYFFGIKRFSLQLIIAVATSFLVETVQHLFNIGVADIDDLVLNTVGALLGILLLRGIVFSNKSHYQLSNRWQTAEEL